MSMEDKKVIDKELQNQLKDLETKVTEKLKPGIIASLGWGQINGYLEKTSNTAKPNKQSYSLTGPCTELELSYTSSFFDFSILYKTLLGIKNQEEFDIKVIWPFNFILFKLGISL